MRNAGRLKLGYYPLPQEEGTRLRKLLHFKGPAAVIDPCAGTGAALLQLTEGAECTRHAVELDAVRAQAAAASGLRTIQGSVFDVQARVETFSLLYLNPPYDSEIASLGSQRMEYLFLDHTYRWLAIGGVLVFVIPLDRLNVCIPALAANFTDIRVYRLDAPESVRFNQIAITGIRKHVRAQALEDNRIALRQYAYGHRALLDLDGRQPAYPVPALPDSTLTYRGLPLDLIEDRILDSPAWKQLSPFALPKQEITGGRPITPLHGGHVGLLCTAGLLNGVFGQGTKRHIARWRSVKHTTVTVEKEDGATITRKRERFSNELALIFEDGRSQVLSESPAKTAAEEDDHAECSPSVRAA